MPKGDHRQGGICVIFASKIDIKIKVSQQRTLTALFRISSGTFQKSFRVRIGVRVLVRIRSLIRSSASRVIGRRRRSLGRGRIRSIGCSSLSS